MAEAEKKPNADEIYEGLTGTQKCAILMMLIGEDEAAEIMGNLSRKEVQVLGCAMYSVQGLGQDTVNLVLVLLRWISLVIFHFMQDKLYLLMLLQPNRGRMRRKMN